MAPPLQHRQTPFIVGISPTRAAGFCHAPSPLKPIADDSCMDLLLFDKVTRTAIPLPIMCRPSYDDPKAQTVQFRRRLKTFTQ